MLQLLHSGQELCLLYWRVEGQLELELEGRAAHAHGPATLLPAGRGPSLNDLGG